MSCTLRGCRDNRNRAVALETEVEQTERLGDHPRIEVVIHRHRISQKGSVAPHGIGSSGDGNLAEMHDVAAACPELAGEALERAERALAARRPPDPIDLHEARARFAALLAGERAVTA